MLSMKSVASALVLVASAADLAAPVLIVPALLLGVSTAARAETPVQSVHREAVAYRDLNLAAPNGKAVFQARVRGAAKDVCAPQADMRNLDEVADYKACVAKAVRDAISAMPDVRQQASQPVHAG